MELAVSNHGRESLLLNRSGAQVDAVEHRRVQNVDAGVDTVADELDGLLDKSIDARRVARLVNNNAVLGGLFDLGDTDGTLITVGLVECGKFLEGVFARNIRIEDEKGGVIFTEHVGSQLQGTSSAEGLGLDRERDLDAKLLLVLFSGHGSSAGAMQRVGKGEWNKYGPLSSGSP